MSSPFTEIDDLNGIWAALSNLDPEKKLLKIGMQRVSIAEDSHLTVREAVNDLIGNKDGFKNAKITILSDNTPIFRGPNLLKEVVLNQLGDFSNISFVELTSGNGVLHCDQDVLEIATKACAGSCLIITIGSGTITDIGKVAAGHNSYIPHIAIQTAASVDGFTDNVSIILKDGVKRTVPSAWPSIVLADLKTIGSAPREMNLAGFGEAISIFTGPADYQLSYLVGVEQNFHEASLKMLEATASSPPDWASGLATGDAHSIYNLIKLLALRGIVPGVSNTTACLSGVEHTISHMLDLYRGAKGLEIGLHGEQVGLGSVVAARLWKEALEHDIIDPKRLKVPDLAEMHDRVKLVYEGLDEKGLIAAECWRDCKKKYKKVISNWPNLVKLVEGWKDNSSVFTTLVGDPHILENALNSSGAPSSFSDLKFPVNKELAIWAVTNCHLMRDRFTLVDFLDLLGLWSQERVNSSLKGLIGE